MVDRLCTSPNTSPNTACARLLGENNYCLLVVVFFTQPTRQHSDPVSPNQEQPNRVLFPRNTITFAEWSVLRHCFRGPPCTPLADSGTKLVVYVWQRGPRERPRPNVTHSVVETHEALQEKTFDNSGISAKDISPCIRNTSRGSSNEETNW